MTHHGLWWPCNIDYIQQSKLLTCLGSLLVPMWDQLGWVRLHRVALPSLLCSHAHTVLGRLTLVGNIAARHMVGLRSFKRGMLLLLLLNQIISTRGLVQSFQAQSSRHFRGSTGGGGLRDGVKWFEVGHGVWLWLRQHLRLILGSYSCSSRLLVLVSLFAMVSAWPVEYHILLIVIVVILTCGDMQATRALSLNPSVSVRCRCLRYIVRRCGTCTFLQLRHPLVLMKQLRSDDLLLVLLWWTSRRLEWW